VLVLDVSPSMEDTDWKPSRLHAAMEAAIAYCRRLAEEEPQARVAIVAYGGSAKVVCGLTQASAFDALVAHIRQLAIIGRTNITDGLVEAYRLLEGLAPCQVVLLTDGHHNTGPRPDGVSHHLQRLAAIECVGIGGSPKDVDEPLLKAIASTRPDGTKRYRWIGQKEDLIEHFRNLGGGLSRA
jgi:Ca-activated chloride channel family protein